MKFQIKHEIKGRIRIHAAQTRMTFAQADTLQYYLTGYDFIKNSGREMNRFYWDKLMDQVILHYGTQIFLPMSIRAGIATMKSVKYIWEGLCTLAKGKIEVPVLDGTAIGVSVVDCTERAEIHVNYGTALKDLDLIHLKKAGVLSDQERVVKANRLLVQNVWYRKDENSKQEDYFGRGDFAASLDGTVEITGEEKSLGSISSNKTLEPGEYTLDLVMKVGEQNIHVLRTIFVDKIDLSKYSDYNPKILVNEKELSDEPISCNYTKEEVKTNIEIIDVETNAQLLENKDYGDYICDYINNVDVAEADQDNAPTIIVQGMGNDVGRGDNSGKGNIGTERDTDTDADSGGDRNAGAVEPLRETERSQVYSLEVK